MLLGSLLDLSIIFSLAYVIHGQAKIRKPQPTSEEPPLHDTKTMTCEEAMRNSSSQTGVIQLEPGLTVLCINDPWGIGNAFTVIQRRQNGELNFTRTWKEYRTGFGSPHKEFWLGLERVHQWTSSQNYQLWILVRDYSGKTQISLYDHFSVESEGNLYRLNISGFSGDTTNAFNYHNGASFATVDKDINGCAKIFKGGWWYKNCLMSNLNGIYDPDDENGIKWHAYQEHIKYTLMAIRPTDA